MFKVITRFSSLVNHYESIYSKAEIQLQNPILVELNNIDSLDLVNNELIRFRSEETAQKTKIQ